MPGAVMALDVVMQRAALAQRHADETLARLLGRLADRLRYLASLARAVTDAALAVTDDDERSEAEAPAALHHLGAAVDTDKLLDELALLAIPRLPVTAAPLAAPPPAPRAPPAPAPIPPAPPPPPPPT